MRRVIQGGLVALATMWVGSGCATACDELQEICDRCRDPGHKASCEGAVDDGDEDKCSLNVEEFEDICR